MQTLILVESHFPAFKLYELGFRNVVALMGLALSNEQAALITDFLGPDGRVILDLDDNKDGAKCAQDALTRLKKRLFVKVVDVSKYGKIASFNTRRVHLFTVIITD